MIKAGEYTVENTHSVLPAAMMLIWMLAEERYA